MICAQAESIQAFFQHLSGPGVRAWQALAPDGRAGAEREEEEAGDGLEGLEDLEDLEDLKLHPGKHFVLIPILEFNVHSQLTLLKKIHSLNLLWNALECQQ